MNGTTEAPKERKESSVLNPKMQFVLTGFAEVPGFRVFAFEGVAADRSRTDFSVKADLVLARRYGIRLQEFPLLCRALLEQRHEGVDKRSFIYSEDDMRVYADAAAARVEAAQKRKPPRRPASDQVGNAWRASPLR